MPRAPRAVQTPGAAAPAEAESEELQAAEVQPEPAAADPAPEVESDGDIDYREQARGLRAKDVDATRLKRSVLTLDGWVCPAKAPAAPGRE